MSARSRTPTRKGHPPGPTLDDDEDPTEIDGGNLGPEAVPALPHAPIQPIKAISMKTPHDGDTPVREVKAPVLPAVKLRALSEVTRAQAHQPLGNLAPPYDPRVARAKTTREYIVWGSIAVIIASVVAVIVWFVGR
jgi:hypothetical protein